MNGIQRSPIIVALAILALISAVEPLKAAQQPPLVSERNRSLEEVIIVFKTHFDIGYTDLASSVLNYYRTAMIDGALEVCDQSRMLPPEQRFVWTLSGWPMTQILWEGQTPERRERVLNAYKEGRFVTHALPFTTHTESLELEDLVRGLGFASRLSRSAGLELPRDAKMTDVPCHSWVLPTLLRHAGVEFLHLGCNAGSAAVDVPALFWWEGPDGSRLLTMYSAEYGSGLTPPQGWPHKSWLALIHSGDNQGPPSPEEVFKLLDEAKRKLPGVRIRMGRLQDFADAILREKTQLPVVRGDMPDTWIHGLLSMPTETKLARNVRPEINALELLNTLMETWVGSARQASALTAAYEQSLLYGEHTWGMDVKKFGKRVYGAEWKAAYDSGRYRKLEASFAQHGAYIKEAEGLTTAELKANLQSLARAVSVRGARIVVFNPLPWQRDGVVSVRVAGKAPAAVKPYGSNAAVSVSQQGDTIAFVARNVPPMGYRTYVAADPAAYAVSDLKFDKNTLTMENAFFRVRLDPKRGSIASILDRPTGRELVDTKSPLGFGQFLHERFSQAEVDDFVNSYTRSKAWWVPGDFGKPELPPAGQAPYAAITGSDMSLELHRNHTSVSALVEGTLDKRIAQKVTLTVTLFENQPALDLSWTIVDKQPDPWPEAGWLCLPFNVAQPRFRLGRLGAVVDPSRDLVRGSNHEIYCLNGGMALIGPDGGGVGLCPLDSPLVSLGHPGIWKYSKEFVPAKPVVFLNLYNNQWSTNFPQWISGSWSSRVRLWSIEKHNDKTSLVVPSWNARSKLLAAFTEGPSGSLPASQAGMELSREGVLVTAFSASPDGPGLILRLWEQAGQDGPCRVRLPQGLQAKVVQPVDLRSRPQGAKSPVVDRRFTIDLKHYAPATFLIAP